MFNTFNHEKSYRKLFFAGIINGIGDRFSQVALLALILQMTGSGLSVGITMALRMIPFLFFSPLSSSLARKAGRKTIMIVTDLARAVIALSFLAVNNPADMWIVYAASFLLASGEAIYSPIRKTSIPAIVSSKSLKEINGWEQVLMGFVLVIGALSGGVVSYLLGAKAAFLLNIVSFLVAGWIISTLPSLEGEIVNEPINKPNHEKYSELLPVIAASSFLLMLMLFELIIPLVNGIENILISVYAVKTFGKADLGVGIFYSVLGLGLIISPLFTRMVKKRFLLFSFLCIIGEGLFLATVSQTKAFWLAAVLFCMTAVFSGVGNTLLDTVAMDTIPSKWHGMYFGITSMLSNTFIGVSMFLTGIALEWFDPRFVGMFGGVMYLAAGTFFLLWSLKYSVAQEKRKLIEKAM
ncbi:MFS transporter [Mesobacillus subterraneus]|uniref:MFS transporter n=1 Tax=Mesobacillus subterraneus TaxID=285983 RepID=UPI001CFDE465|nr:MFS transporter [Mesobacillus subterraneus]WLR57048.1 MFS transporter [Mesobacillus subterraneus]